MDFRTILPTHKSNIHIDHSNKIMCIGSCFAENIYNKLNAYQFYTRFSPFGIVFNPISMGKQITKLLQYAEYTEDNLILDQGLFHSMDHHGIYSDEDRDVCLNQINTAYTSGSTFLGEANVLIMTLGSSHYYIWNETQLPVSNCHKIPQNKFTLHKASTQYTLDHLIPSIELLQQKNKNIKIVLTVSPVRYLKYGFVENMRSKASLILACEALEKTFGFINYFPAYEIVMDDLRDYRFMKNDLVHVSDMAIQYVWNRFQEFYFEKETIDILKQLDPYIKLKEHRPLKSNQSDKIKIQIAEMENKLSLQFPQLNWNK